MNSISYPLGGGSLHRQCSQQNMDSNRIISIRNFNKAYNGDIMPYQTHHHHRPDSLKQLNSINNLNSLFKPIPDKIDVSKMDDSRPLNLSLPKKNNAGYSEINNPSFNQLSLLRSLILEKQHDAKNKKSTKLHRAPWRHHGQKTAAEQRAIVFNACLPGSSCCWMAKKHNIPHQYIFKWCIKHYGMTIRAYKDFLASALANDTLKENSLLKFDNQSFFERMSNRKHRVYSLEQKKSIINEACKRDTAVYDVARRHEISLPSIYQWCKKIYNLGLKDLRQKQRLTFSIHFNDSNLTAQKP